MMDYNAKTLLEPSEAPRGVDVHPHRGFETVTVAYKGKVAHHDSAGNSGVIGEGEVQWMTAASGILHKEYHEKEFSKQGGEFQMVQLWVNLPAKYKMSAPKYQGITRSMLKSHLLPEGMGSVEVIAGEHKGTKGAAFTFSPVHLFNIELKNDAVETFEFPSHYNTAILVIEGSIQINDSSEALKDHLVLMANDAEQFTIKANMDTKILMLSGEPLNEPIAAHGPFVMNTREELIQAFRDFQNGKFGELN